MNELTWKGTKFSDCSESDHGDAKEFIKGLTLKDGEILTKYAIPWLLKVIEEKEYLIDGLTEEVLGEDN